jgi:hypothetical protein
VHLVKYGIPKLSPNLLLLEFTRYYNSFTIKLFVMKIITVQARTADKAAQIIAMVMIALGFVVGKRGLLITYDELARTATLETEDKETIGWFRVYGTALLGTKMKRYYWDKSAEGHIIHNLAVDTSKPYLSRPNTDYMKYLER